MRRLLAMIVALIVAASATAGVVVATVAGPVSGEAADDVLVFKGIPYAAAPVGPLRWRPPQQAVPWTPTRDATRVGASCPQPQRRDRSADVGVTSEDCLYLNVWTKSVGGKRPVMVWLHGGAFRIGSGSMPIYDGARFAQRGVVLVTLNYRLGRFGFFAHPALVAAHPKDARGNYGLMDQAAALAWVKANIAAFGGDPDNVTVFGESAGGASVLHLLTSPKTDRLFQKAIIESGGGHQFDRRLDVPRGLRQSLQEQGIAWAESVGLEAGADAAALRAVSMEQVLGGPSLTGGIGEVGPVIDGDWVPDDPGVRIARGEFHLVPLLLGANSYEASVLAAFGTDASEIVTASGVDRAALRRLYAGLVDDDTALADQVFGDASFLAGARHVARSMTARDAPVYLYHFDYVLERRRGKVPGAAHGAEVPYVFDNFDKLPVVVRMLTSREDTAMAARVNRYWLNFATTGDPNGAGLPRWPKYSTAADELLLLRPEISIAPGFRAPQLDFMQQRWEAAEVSQPR